MSEIAIKDLKELCLKALTKTGLSEEHAEITVDHYLENELSGKTSHGMVRIPQIIKSIKTIGLPNKEMQTVTDKRNIAVIDGHMNLGPVIGKQVVDESIKRAKKHGISFVGGRHYCGNTGSMAYYLRLIAKEGLIGLMSCNSESMVTAPNGKERLIGTNPIGIGVPSDDGNHFIADFATSAIAYGKVMVAVDKGEPLPEGCIIDKDGSPSTTPEDARIDGAILPLADYRGFALGLFVELMAAMIGATALHSEQHGEAGFFIIAIDPTHLGNDSYTTKVEAILNQIRDSAPAPDNDDVSLPGDRSAATLKQNLKNGTIDMTDKTLQNIQDLAMQDAA